MSRFGSRFIRPSELNLKDSREEAVTHTSCVFAIKRVLAEYPFLAY
jgi:hypothetical protein